MASTDQQQIPLFSPINLFIAGIAIIVLIIVLFVQGNNIFSPGDLSSSHLSSGTTGSFSSHADFEQQCDLCHKSLSKTQAELCVSCHTNIADQLAVSSGVHGQMQNASECRLCHPDHRGREFDMVTYARQTFDHTKTNFSLDTRHSLAACQDCHKADVSVVTSNCESCHEEPAVHKGIFPTNCGECHQGTAWSSVTWNEQPYDHDLTGFSLNLHQRDYQGDPIQCQDCHSTSAGVQTDDLCQQCHSSHDNTFMVQHIQEFGRSCIECHDGFDRMQSFDHASVFALEGKHTGLNCATCHTGRDFNEAKTVCASCHQEPEIHAGYFGLRCQLCHTADGWAPARLTSHDFPIDHGTQGEVSCVTCHPSAYTEYDCFACHEHEEPKVMALHEAAKVETENISECSTCHLDGLVHSEP